MSKPTYAQVTDKDKHRPNTELVQILENRMKMMDRQHKDFMAEYTNLLSGRPKVQDTEETGTMLTTDEEYSMAETTRKKKRRDRINARKKESSREERSLIRESGTLRVESDGGKINVAGKKPVAGLRTAKTAAILIRSQNSQYDYGALLRKARGRINITELGIDVSRIKPSFNGGVLMEIPV